ncbi:MAG: CPBP family intramembrane glutamic endopeptidase [Candidatus Hodarchaeales archaeon]
MYIYSPLFVDLGRSLFHTPVLRFLPLFAVFILFTVFRLIVPTSPDPLVTVFQVLACLVFIFVPSLLYSFFSNLTKNGFSFVDVIAGLWVWLPIEFGLIDDFIGAVELGNIPFETLLALFAFIYALIFIRQHDMGLTFTLSLNDILFTLKVILILMVIIAPLGMLTYFLAPPNVIWETFLSLITGIPSSLVEITLTFLTIFLGIALIEEMFFRGFFYSLLEQNFAKREFSKAWWYGGVLGLVGLIIITPLFDDGLFILSQWIPMLSPLQEIIGPLAEPLGVNEGQPWPLVQSFSLELLYLIVALILGTVGIILVYKTNDPVIAALIISSILFGWAHFEDVRYILFASIAGFGYGWIYWKTEKIVPAALVHMAVDAIWSLLFSFP